MILVEDFLEGLFIFLKYIVYNYIFIISFINNKFYID